MTTAEVAAALGISERGVRKLIQGGRLVATKPSRDWDVNPASVEAEIARRRAGAEAPQRGPGRPPKSKG